MTPDEVLAGPEYFDCGPMKARISARACLMNQGKAKGLSAFAKSFFCQEACCLTCDLGKKMRAYPPGVFLLPGPEAAPAKAKSPLTPLYKGGEEETENLAGGTLALPNKGQDVTIPLTPAPPRPPRRKKLPARLKNSSAAVQRDYWKEKGAL
jgi:hypothetical protein